MPDLDPMGGTIEVGELGLRTPGFTGRARALAPVDRGGLRAAGNTSEELQAALERARMETAFVLEVEAEPLDRPDRSTPGRGAGGSPGEIELDVPRPAGGFEQAVLSVDESGLATWSFASRDERGAAGSAARGGEGTRTFVIRRAPEGPAPTADGADRSIFGEVGKQLLKVLAFPIGTAVGKAVDDALRDWERTHQPYGIRDFTSATYRSDIRGFDGDPDRWRSLARGRVLVFIHGTFSRSNGAFSSLDPTTMQDLERLYGGRVIAFDHQSISEDPAENAEWFLSTIPDGTHLDADIVCHSRGGLVARSLTERLTAQPGARRIRFRRTALVGVVNDGTILADVGHWNQLIDVLSTVLNTVGFVVGDTVDLILSFVRQIAVAAYPQLRGLACMVPGGPFLAELNARPRDLRASLAVGSNFEPVDGRLRSWLSDGVDALFGRLPNDTMVPIDSVVGTDGGPFGRFHDAVVLDEHQGVPHSGYFSHPGVRRRLVEWLADGLGNDPTDSAGLAGAGR
jgi:hypothetical protein